MSTLHHLLRDLQQSVPILPKKLATKYPTYFPWKQTNFPQRLRLLLEVLILYRLQVSMR